MGTDYWGNLVIGYPIDPEQFKVTIPQETHLEDRFSEHTGKKLKTPTEIVDKEEEDVYRFEGLKDEEQELEFVEALAKKLGVNIIAEGEMQYGSFSWYICLPINLTSVRTLKKNLEGVASFKRMIKKSGIKVGDFEIDIKVSSG